MQSALVNWIQHIFSEHLEWSYYQKAQDLRSPRILYKNTEKPQEGEGKNKIKLFYLVSSKVLEIYL